MTRRIDPWYPESLIYGNMTIYAILNFPNFDDFRYLGTVGGGKINITICFSTGGAPPPGPPELVGLRPPRFIWNSYIKSYIGEAEGRLIRGVRGAEPPGE